MKYFNTLNGVCHIRKPRLGGIWHPWHPRRTEPKEPLPDNELYPEFTPLLLESMGQETQAYFAELLAKDLSVTHFVKSDFAMLKEWLARHYSSVTNSFVPKQRRAWPRRWAGAGS